MCVVEQNRCVCERVPEQRGVRWRLLAGEIEDRGRQPDARQDEADPTRRADDCEQSAIGRPEPACNENRRGKTDQERRNLAENVLQHRALKHSA